MEFLHYEQLSDIKESPEFSQLSQPLHSILRNAHINNAAHRGAQKTLANKKPSILSRSSCHVFEFHMLSGALTLRSAQFCTAYFHLQ